MSDKMSIYVIGSDAGPMKIGISTNPRSRLANLQTASPARLSLICSIELDRAKAVAAERLFHETHKRYRLNGEWFSMVPKMAVMEFCIAIARTFLRAGYTKSPELENILLENGVIEIYADHYVDPQITNGTIQ